MKSKDIKSLHDKTKDELLQLASDIKKELFQLRLDKSQNKLKNQRSLSTKRKDIARILSVLNIKLSVVPSQTEQKEPNRKGAVK